VSLTRRTLLAALPLVASAGVLRRALAAAELTGKLTQGSLIIGRVPPGSRVALDGKSARVDGEGRFLLGFGRDAAPTARLAVTGPDGKSGTQSLEIAKRSYDIQRIDGLPQNQVEPNAQELARIKAEQARINKARARDTDIAFFAEGFDWPAIGPISGVYGSQRILNGQPRRPHFGVDVAAPPGTPIKAPCGGIVSLADPDLFFTGGTVLLDHGFGLCSLFAHMRRLTVKEGDRLARGDQVGELGGTGRVTGPHLHWGMYLFNTPLDPQLLVPPMPSEPAAVQGVATQQ
jgi:murein DD-endopeptidase MepM/ murein hydrolase activator NlpD